MGECEAEVERVSTRFQLRIRILDCLQMTRVWLNESLANTRFDAFSYQRKIQLVFAIGASSTPRTPASISSNVCPNHGEMRA